MNADRCLSTILDEKGVAEPEAVAAYVAIWCRSQSKKSGPVAALALRTVGHMIMRAEAEGTC